MNKILVVLFLVTHFTKIQSEEIIGSAAVAVADANADFTNELYGAVRNAQRDNFVISPFSLSSVLAMLRVGADGKTANEIHRALGLTGVNESTVYEGYSDIIFSLHENTEAIVETANRLYTTDKVTIRQPFLQIIREKFYALAKPVNFGRSGQVAGEINEWVSRTTHGRINDIISSDSLGSRTTAVLINAIYFRGKWKDEFDPKDTRGDIFTTANGAIRTVEMMEQEGDYAYAEIPELNAAALEIPYKGDRFSMIVLLPEEGVSISDMETRIGKYVSLADIPKRLQPKYVKLTFPKFRIDSELDFIQNNVLNRLGMRSLTNPGLANFAKISSEFGVYVDALIQKSYIEVDEGGTEAAGASYVKAVPLSYRFATPFTVNRPFIAFIYDSITKTILFIAKKST